MPFLGYFYYILYRTSSKKTRLKKEYYDDEQIIRKCRFYRSLFCDFSRADDHWEVTLALKSAAPCRCILAGVSRSRAFRQPVSRKSRESFLLSGWGSMRQPYTESAIYQLSDTAQRSGYYKGTQLSRGSLQYVSIEVTILGITFHTLSYFQWV